LRARHGKHTAENETRHAVDTGCLGSVRLLCDIVDILLGREQTRNLGTVETDVGGGLRQHIITRQITAFGEIEIHQPLLHASGIAELVSP
jgi:hypothetical protein